MDNRIKELIIGYDLCNDYIQISCYNQKTQDMDTICYIGEKMLDRVPTVLCRLYEDRSWVCGYDAWKAVNEHRGTLVENFVDALESQRAIMVDDDFYSAAELVRIFMTESLKLLTKYYPHWCVGQLTVAVESLGKNTVEALKSLGAAMDFDEQRLAVINHVSAYEHYALNQKRELWQHDVGLFDYSRRGMTYYHLAISKKRMPVAAMATTVPLTEYFDGSEIGQAAFPELDRRFLEVVRKVTANKIISTVYLTGEGFDGDWANISLKNLCHHRKGFIGSNIFSRGACYYSLMTAGLLEEGGFVALNEDVISKTIYIRGSKNREVINKEIVQAGQVWYDVCSDENFITDAMDHITIHLMDYLSRRERSIQLPLGELLNPEGAEKRPDKTGHFKLCMKFDDPSHCHVYISDNGFGEFYPPLEKTVEQVFDIYDETLEDKEVHESGRLILTDGSQNTAPYYFGLSGIRVYSLEQLCYYIYHHIYTINTESFDDDLFYWIEKNLGERALVKRLREAKKNRRTLKEMVRLVLMSVDYYSREEMNQLQKTIEEIEMQNPIETRKVEADNYLRYGRPLEALSVYKKVDLMMDDSEEIVTKEFRGNVYHNMGVAFARLANGEAALAYFKKACEFNDSDVSRDAWLKMLKLLGRESEMLQEINRMLLPPEMVGRLNQEFSEAQADFEKQPVYDMIARMKDIHNESQWDAIGPEVVSWLEEQKGEYRNC